MATDRIELRVRRKKFPLINFFFIVFHFFATEREREREREKEREREGERYLKSMSIISLSRGLSFIIGIGIIWLLSLVCLLMRTMAIILRYTDYLNFITDRINHVLL